MSKRSKIILTSAVIILLILLGVTIVLNRAEKEIDIPVLEVAYFNLEETDDILVFYDQIEKTALLYSSTIAGALLSEVPSASGVRYESPTSNLILWNKGQEVTLYRGEEIIFNGFTREFLESSPEVTPVGRLRSAVWVWQETLLPNDEIITPRRSDDFILTFLDNNRFSASTDCNNIAGNYQAGDRNIEFTNIAMTKMYCEDSQEDDFKEMILRSNRYMFDQEGNLVLSMAFDSGSVFFKRQ